MQLSQQAQQSLTHVAESMSASGAHGGSHSGRSPNIDRQSQAGHDRIIMSIPQDCPQRKHCKCHASHVFVKGHRVADLVLEGLSACCALQFGQKTRRICSQLFGSGPSGLRCLFGCVLSHLVHSLPKNVAFLFIASNGVRAMASQDLQSCSSSAPVQFFFPLFWPLGGGEGMEVVGNGVLGDDMTMVGGDVA